MDTLPKSSSESSLKPPSRMRKSLTETQLLQQLAATKAQLKKVQRAQREHDILRLGRLAFKAGLARLDDCQLTAFFAQAGSLPHVADESVPNGSVDNVEEDTNL